MKRKSRAVARSPRRYFQRRFRGKPKMTIPMAVVAGFAPVAIGIWNRKSNPTEIGNFLQAGFTGVGSDGRFNFGNLRQGAMPIAAGFIAHMVASKLGINRALGRAGIPLIRI